MRIRLLIVAATLGSFQPSVLAAQSADDSTAGGDSITAKNATIFGGSEQVARNMLSSMRLERRQRDLCWEVGCVVIVNESQNFAVTAFHVDSSVKSGKPGWGRNQFRTPLQAMKATYLLKLDEKQSCDLPIQFVLRHVETNEEVKVEGRSDLCRSPQSVSMIRLKVLTPTVSVGNE